MSPASGNNKSVKTFIRLNFVSIQLMSPASGNMTYKIMYMFNKHIVSIQLMSPASGNEVRVSDLLSDGQVSIQLMSPASGN